MGRRLLPQTPNLDFDTETVTEFVDGALVFQDVESVLAWNYQSQRKNLYIIGGKQDFSGF